VGNCQISAALFSLLGLGFLGRDRRLGGLPLQPLSLKPLPVGSKCLLRNPMLRHCRFGIELAKCLTRFALRFGDRLGWLNLARCLCHFFAFSASSKSRRCTRPSSTANKRRRSPSPSQRSQRESISSSLAAKAFSSSSPPAALALSPACHFFAFSPSP